MRYFFTTIFVLLVGCGTLFAQNDTTKIELKKSMLNGHIFTSVNTTKSAFISSSLNSEFSVGSTGYLDLPGFDIGDNQILEFTGNVAFYGSNVIYRQRFTDWLALKVALTLGGRLGTSVSTILVDGLNTYSGGGVGWDFRVVNRPKLQMTGSLFVKNLSGTFIDIAGYINEIIEDVPNPKAIKNIPVLNVGIGGQGAWAFNNTYGLQFGADMSYGESFERGEQRFFSSFNVSGDMDLMPRKKIPLGFALGYMYSSNPEDTYLEFIYTSIYSAKIAYTGSSDFDLGLQFIMNKVRLSEIIVKDPMIVKTQLDFKFYF